MIEAHSEFVLKSLNKELGNGTTSVGESMRIVASSSMYCTTPRWRTYLHIVPGSAVTIPDRPSVGHIDKTVHSGEDG